jgi:hypothetical protein
VWRTPKPQGAIVCWVGALMLMLGCMALAQTDGSNCEQYRAASPSTAKESD